MAVPLVLREACGKDGRAGGGEGRGGENGVGEMVGLLGLCLGSAIVLLTMAVPSVLHEAYGSVGGVMRMGVKW